MKRRTEKARQRAKKKIERRAAMFRSGNNSQYAKKVKAGQLYGPIPVPAAPYGPDRARE